MSRAARIRRHSVLRLTPRDRAVSTRFHRFRSPCAEPAISHGDTHQARSWPVHAYTKRVKLKSKTAVKGGCG